MTVSAAVALAGCGGHKNTYGGLPSWLPKTTIPVGRIVDASVTHPKVGIQGDTIDVTLPASHMLVSLAGPAVPQEGRFPLPLTVPCTFTVTFAHLTGRPVALSAGDFVIIDEIGKRIPVTLAGMDGGAAPATVSPGSPTSFQVEAMVPPGAGTVAWSPGTPKPITAWDFTVEVD